MTDEPQPWDRLDDESGRAYAAFCVYRDLGPDRKVCEAVRIHYSGKQCKSQVAIWSQKYKWADRVQAYDLHLQRVREAAAAAAAEAEAAKLEAERVQAQRDRITAGRLAVQRVREALEATTATEIPKGVLPQLLKAGADLCRLEDGEATEMIQHASTSIVVYLPDNGRDSG
jgi:hypothetical protein